ncbi:MAG: HD domain-containing protein [Firmicutes bacterium]|nr:HD domain-containing protein [Bacillota bacterium]
MKNKTVNKIILLFIVTFLIIIACMGLSIINNNIYNSEVHQKTLSGEKIFEESAEDDVSVAAAARSSTWGKVFDFNNEGLTDNNYQAYTYDITVKNNTDDEVSNFSFKFTFNRNVYLSSAWNGSLEIHQNVKTNEIVDTVSDLREFVPDDYMLKTVNVDGESLITMNAGDYFIYTPSSSMNAMEIPIKPSEATTPGIILYVPVGEDIEDSVMELEYILRRSLTNELLFRVSLAGAVIWLAALIICAITSAQIKKYKERYERDNVIISESIETFTGFIDAKDPYTNGHSKRVAIYIRQIAKEFGYNNDELNRIYYVALLHDCGKIGIPDNILRKPEGLSDEEYEIMKSHTIVGSEILSHFKSLKNVGEGARYHHERYDGKGYPDGKAGEEIPFIARMICVADAFDAMNTNRVYRKKLTKEDIINEIEKEKGYHFDPKVADVMLKLLKNGKISMDR